VYNTTVRGGGGGVRVLPPQNVYNKRIWLLREELERERERELHK
jgi:hypothetical protein